MHLDKAVAHLQRTVPLLELGLNLTPRELENDSASLGCCTLPLLMFLMIMIGYAEARSEYAPRRPFEVLRGRDRLESVA